MQIAVGDKPASRAEFIDNQEAVSRGILPIRTVSGDMAGYHSDPDLPLFDLSQPDVIETLQVIFKLVERCNINCTYCYYFNMGDKTALGRPAMVDLGTTQELARWLAQGCRDLRIPRVLVSFHGGEPMMLKPHKFDAVCRALRAEIEPAAKLDFSMQTNGTILNDEWLEILATHHVRVGVSIDGDRVAHNRFRLDYKGRSTFEKTTATINRLVEVFRHDPRMMPSTISVVDHRNDYRQVYRFLRRLGVQQMNFLLPDRNADDIMTGKDGTAGDYGKALLDIFEEWLTEDNTAINIRFIHRTLRYFQFRLPDNSQLAVTDIDSSTPKKDYQIIVARSDGTIALNDSFIPALEWYRDLPVYSIRTCSLRDYFKDGVFNEIERWSSLLPHACRRCRWKRICKGGDLENRFSTRTLFDNPSVYCDAYKLFYEGVCDLLIANGYPAEAVPVQLGWPADQSDVKSEAKMSD